MKISDEFVIRDICNTTVVIPIGTKIASGCKPSVLNEAGACIAKAMINEIDKATLLAKVKEKYTDVPDDQLSNGIDAFIENGVNEGYITA